MRSWSLFERCLLQTDRRASSKSRVLDSHRPPLLYTYTATRRDDCAEHDPVKPRQIPTLSHAAEVSRAGRTTDEEDDAAPPLHP